jgi:hypothetical protein
MAATGVVAAGNLGWLSRRPALAAANPTQAENARTGSADWELVNPALQREIEGYASRTSVNRGEPIQLFVNTADPTYSIDIFRMGWYGGLGGRRVLPTITRAGTSQVIPQPDPTTGRVECHWVDPYVLSTGNPSDSTDWPSGVYLARLTAGSSRKQSYIVFVVRDDARPSDFLFQCAVNTYQAYNNWGGKSIYIFNSTGDPATKISFNRPYAANPYGTRLDGASDFLRRWEYNMVRFLEREGYDVTYTTDVDTHQNPRILLPHRGILIVGHNEYWSWEMRQNIVAARDAGVSLGFFGGNVCYWQMRYEPSPLTGDANQTLVCYKDAGTDPYALDNDPSNDHLVTVRWREDPVNLPEDAFIGVQFVWENDGTDNIVIQNAGSWVCRDTGLKNGDPLVGLLGYEVDREFGDQPPGTEVVAHSPLPGTTEASDMTAYTAGSGATVFAAGSIGWAWGLDDYNAPALHPNLVSPAAQQMTRNVLARMLGNRAQARARRRAVHRIAAAPVRGGVLTADLPSPAGASPSFEHGGPVSR